MEKATTTFQEGNYGCWIRVNINQKGILKFQIEDDFFDNNIFDEEEKENIQYIVNKANKKEFWVTNLNQAKAFIIKEFDSPNDFYFYD